MGCSGIGNRRALDGKGWQLAMNDLIDALIYAMPKDAYSVIGTLCAGVSVV